MRPLLIPAALSLSAITLLAGYAAAQTVSWDGGAATDAWDDALNWDSDTVPTQTDIVTIGDLPAGVGASVRLNQNQFARRVELSSGATLDTDQSRLLVLGNVVVRDDQTRLVVRAFEPVVLNPSLDVYNVTLREHAIMEITGAKVQIITPGAGLASFGVLTTESDTTFLATGGGQVVFLDGLDGGEATQFNNNGTLRVTQPTAPDPGVSYTLRIESGDPGSVADLDGDGGTGVIDLGEFAVLNVFTKTAPFSSVADLADRAQLLYSHDATFGSSAVVNFNGAGLGSVTNRLRSDGTLTAQSGATFNINSGVTEVRGQLIADAGSQINVADNATLAFDAPPVGDGSVRTTVLGAVNLGSGSNLSVEGDVLLGAAQLDWDGAENAETVVNAGGRLTIEADTIESTAGDDTFNGRIEVFGGATAGESASVRTDVTQGWRMAGFVRLRGMPVGAGYTANFLNSTDNTFTIDPAGVVSLDGGAIGSQSNGVIVNEGVIEGSGLIGAEGFSNNGLIRAVAGDNDDVLRTTLAQNIDLDGSDQVNPGDVEAIDGDIAIQGRLTDNFGGVATVGPGRKIDFQIGWILGAPATLNLNGGAEPATIDSSGIDNGGINQQDGETTLRGTVNVVNTGRILGDSVVRSGATINLTDNFGSLEFGGDTEVQAGVAFSPDGQVVNLADGVMTVADGVDFGGVTLVNDGQLVVDGDANGTTFTQRSTGDVRIEIGGTMESEYDQLVFDVFQQLAGTLTVEFNDGFVASDGDTFSVLKGLVGVARFDEVLVPELPAGLDWFLDYEANALVLSVESDGGDPLPGDYTGDGVVDAADYTAWRDTLGSTTDLAADGDGDGMIDTDDYDVWVANYGATSSALAVPEPGALVAVLIGATTLPWRRVASAGY